MALTAERQKLLEAEVTRLNKELVVLDRQWRKKHLLAFFGLLTLPGYYFFGAPALFLGLLGTPALVLTQTYLLAVRREECTQMIDEARRMLSPPKGRPREGAAPARPLDGPLTRPKGD